jgi:hypothetical protein
VDTSTIINGSVGHGEMAAGSVNPSRLSVVIHENDVVAKDSTRNCGEMRRHRKT